MLCCLSCRTRSAIRTRTATVLGRVPPASWATRALWCWWCRALGAIRTRTTGVLNAGPLPVGPRGLGAMPERGAASRRVDGVAQVVPASEPGGRDTRRSRPASAAAPRPRTPTTRQIRATRMPIRNIKKDSIYRERGAFPSRARKSMLGTKKPPYPDPGGRRRKRLVTLPARSGVEI